MYYEISKTRYNTAVTFRPEPMKNVIARCFQRFDRVERSKENDRLFRIFFSLSLFLSPFFFSFFNEIVLVLQRGKFTERQWNIVAFWPYSVFISALFYSPSYVSSELFWSSFSSSSSPPSFSFFLSNSRCSCDVSQGRGIIIKLSTVGECRTTRLDHATGERLDRLRLKMSSLFERTFSLYLNFFFVFFF